MKWFLYIARVGLLSTAFCFAVRAQNEQHFEKVPMYWSMLGLTHVQGQQNTGSAYAAQALQAQLQVSLMQHFFYRDRGKFLQCRDFFRVSAGVGHRAIDRNSMLWLPYQFQIGALFQVRLTSSQALQFRFCVLKAAYDQILPFEVASGGTLAYALKRWLFECTAEARYERFMQWIPGLIHQSMQMQYQALVGYKTSTKTLAGIRFFSYHDRLDRVSPENQIQFQAFYGFAF